jgi:hypothetical protein
LDIKMFATNGYYQPEQATEIASEESDQATVELPAQGKVVAPNAFQDSTPICRTPTNSVPTHQVPTHHLPAHSAPTSHYPVGDFRNSSQEALRDTQSIIMVYWLRQMQMEKLWSRGLRGEGVILKKGRDNFTCCPETLKDDSAEFYNQIVCMNVRVCLIFLPSG